MRLILDTHILVWTLGDTRALPDLAKILLLDPANDKFVSVVSLWEIAIKQRLRRGRGEDMRFDVEEILPLVEQAGLKLLPINPLHTLAVAALPLERPADPFDRMLVAQATSAAMRLRTRAVQLASYGEAVLLG